MVEFSKWVGGLSKVTDGVTGKRMYVSLGDGTSAYTEPGQTANDIVSGDDTRLSNPRTPLPHASTHASGGADSIKLDALATPDDNTNLNATTSAHGLLPKLAGGETQFLRADGTWATPPTGSGATSGNGSTAGGATPGGSAAQVQYNKDGTFGGTEQLTIATEGVQVGTHTVAEVAAVIDPDLSASGTITLPDSALGKRCRYTFTTRGGVPANIPTFNPPVTAPASGYGTIIVVEVHNQDLGQDITYAVKGATISGQAIDTTVASTETRFIVFEYSYGGWFYQGRIDAGDVVIPGGAQNNIVTIAADGSLQDGGQASCGVADLRTTIAAEDSSARRIMNVANDFGHTKQHSYLRLSHASAQYDVVKNTLKAGQSVIVRWTNATPSQAQPFTNSGGGVLFVPSAQPAVTEQYQALQLVCVDDTADKNVFDILPASL